MLVILEGPDGAGKSTLGTYLASQTGRPLLHSPGVTQGELEMKAWALRMLTSPLRDSLILDRFPLVSELIYGPVLRNKALISRYHPLHTAWHRIPTTLIYCRPPIDVIREAVIAKGESQQLLANLPDIIKNYDQLISELVLAHAQGMSKILVHTFDYTRDSMDLVVDAIQPSGQASREYQPMLFREEHFK